ncbi:MAG: hypothetical protein CVV64_20855 [Candidatus Wallbacteria bacterium HGW-Wallbacteria-1]|jgi:hypothetical protein|uniref:DUF4276 domain-containing protein n=1 Tax=Candidatus Wallbacteria bacterium HGW-Wallbacteria-1 TaxID=2013854 RepID=A0A2N1PI04_9BACT|nr:MAG: hypothetical protein CVV64_20855 [Candidatus Wallbacteria bacterium HGW-Wallbacteria-1]PKL27061.1 MAG: hypothetical protein CVV46_13620 [Spirochaetae bacterium HGW-Spirochaetae-2]
MLEKLLVFVEEYSMQVTLEQILPQMLGEINYQVFPFQCKDELLKELPIRLRGFRSWIPEAWSIIVLVDRDDDNCIELKQQLEIHAHSAGLITRSSSSEGRKFEVINRIVIEELEAWFFGDWNAVRTAYPRVPATIPKQAKYRNPDAIKGGTWEALERILQRAGYFSTGLRKSECAREIAQHMDIHHNTSHSFSMFKNAIESIL